MAKKKKITSDLLLHQAVIYNDKTHYVSEEDGKIGLTSTQQGAWGNGYFFVPDDWSKVTTMYGDKISKHPTIYREEAVKYKKLAKGGNTSDEYITHIYRKRDKEESEILNELTIPYKLAFGNVKFDVDDVFLETGSEDLKYRNVGYGGVDFMGNINGKVPTQGLYYKDKETKEQIERAIRRLQSLFDETQESITHVEKQHGQPKTQHAILAHNAKKIRDRRKFKRRRRE